MPLRCKQLQSLTISMVCLTAAHSVFAIDCLIEPAQLVDIASPVTGLLESVTVKRADRVKRGQVLATLNSHAEQAALELAEFKSKQVGPREMAESKIEFAKRKYARRLAMSAEKLMAPQERDEAEAELRLAESALTVTLEDRQIALLEHQQQLSLLNLRTMRSPFDGVVVDVLAHPGEVVEPGASKKMVLKLAQLDPLQVQVVLPADAFGKVGSGVPVDVIPEMVGKRRYMARVVAVDRLVNAASGTFVVILELANPLLAIPAGVKCQAIFPAGLLIR